MSNLRKHPVRLVQPNGHRVLDREYGALVSDVGPEQLRQMYSDMVLTRRVDAAAIALQRQGELGLWTPALGQEAAQIGSAHALRQDDFVFTSYREHGVVLCRGVDPADMTPLWRGAAHSGWDPYEFNTTNPNLVVGSQGLHAVGYAYATKLDSADTGVIVYLGDGASSQGDMAEAFVFASTWSVPVVFFCQNNHWAISVPVSTQSATPIAQRASGYGIPSIQVDGNDALGVLAVTRQAMNRAREGAGPSFIEALTYRMESHTTSDDASRYRTAAEVESWRARDPIDRIRKLLERENQFDAEFEALVEKRANAAAERIRTETIATATPALETLFEDVYSTPNPLLEAERNEYLSFIGDLA